MGRRKTATCLPRTHAEYKNSYSLVKITGDEKPKTPSESIESNTTSWPFYLASIEPQFVVLLLVHRPVFSLIYRYVCLCP